MCAVAAVALVAAMLSPGEAAYGGGGMSPDYYKTTCPQLEGIVREEVTRKKNETIVTIPAVLRLFFHDCLVNVSSPSLRGSIHGSNACYMCQACIGRLVLLTLFAKLFAHLTN